ncbi:uncharacterized protein LOC122949043 [Acropora millepora]|uniref:uncharacterized protein LOC122949043 n=1 Tax=Acropora millepora TaxID=45264 RepID=UPI001CF22C1D|nr:uncharacterized protein LOC122949043 [Acropora millepora]
MAAFSISSLASFFADEQKSLTRGENHYKSSFSYSDGIIHGEIHASMKKKVYKVTIYLDEEHTIKSTDCECPRGKFKCSHAAALFIHGIYNLSRTDIECQWRKRKATNALLPSVQEMFPPTKPGYKALVDVVQVALNLKAVEAAVRSVDYHGLVWGTSKFLPVAYGIQEMQISCVVEDDKIGTDFLEEKITEFEDNVQSVDVVALNTV